MRDLAGDDALRMERVASCLRKFLGAKGYGQVSTPIVEDANLFIRKSGGELVSQLYSFTDPAGRTVCLRPEFTSAVIRYHLSLGQAGETPARYQYLGPVFRYDANQIPVRHQRTQLGAELIGALNGNEPDSEVVWLAWRGLMELGLQNVRLRIGSVGLLLGLLNSFELSESARVFVSGSVGELTSGATEVARLVTRAEVAGLVKASTRSRGEALVSQDSMEMAGDVVRNVAGELVLGPTGRRTSEQIAARLTRKAREANDPAELSAALELVGLVARLSGPPSGVLAKAAGLLGANGVEDGALMDLESLVASLIARGVPESSLWLDLGLARGIAYYTGVVFELGPVDSPGAFGGGGRYDGLVRALGGEDGMPAIGFSYDLDRVVVAVEDADSLD